MKTTFRAKLGHKTIYNKILSNLAEGVIVTDSKGKFLFFNDKAKSILGIGLQDVPPEQWAAVYGCYYPDGRTLYPADELPLAKALKNQHVSNEVIFIRNDKRPEGTYINVCAGPLSNGNGTVEGGTVVLQDITENIRTQKANKESEKRLKAQFKGMPLPTYVFQRRDTNFVLVDYNDAAKNLTRDKIKQHVGQSIKNMYPDNPELYSSFEKCYREKRSFSKEMAFALRSTGEQKDLIVSFVSVSVDIILVHIEDITQRKKNEAALRKLSQAVEQTADSIIITDRRGFIDYVNPAFEKTTGYSRQEVLGKRPSVLKSGLHDVSFYRNIWQNIMNGEPYRGTIINRKKNGELYWSEQTITPMKDPNGEIAYFVSVLKDITELRKRQEHEFQLRVARRAQQALYKESIDVPGFDIYGKTFPALETNGDYFDFIKMKDGYIGIVMGDVSGHGIAPAFIMSGTRAYLRGISKLETDPAHILTLLNEQLVTDLDEKHFVTMIFTRLDPKNGELVYSSAGHVPAYHLDGQGKIKTKLEATGVPLGFMQNYQFENGTPTRLSANDLILFLTDGITEAHSFDRREFGYDRAIESVRRTKSEKAQQIIDHLYSKVKKFTGEVPQEDDITAAVCKAAGGIG